MWLPGALTDMLVRFTAQFILAQTNPWHLQDHHFPAFDTTSWGKIPDIQFGSSLMHQETISLLSPEDKY